MQTELECHQSRRDNVQHIKAGKVGAKVLSAFHAHPREVSRRKLKETLGIMKHSNGTGRFFVSLFLFRPPDVFIFSALLCYSLKVAASLAVRAALI